MRGVWLCVAPEPRAAEVPPGQGPRPRGCAWPAVPAAAPEPLIIKAKPEQPPPPPGLRPARRRPEPDAAEVPPGRGLRPRGCARPAVPAVALEPLLRKVYPSRVPWFGCGSTGLRAVRLQGTGLRSCGIALLGFGCAGSARSRAGSGIACGGWSSVRHVRLVFGCLSDQCGGLRWVGYRPVVGDLA